VAVSSEQIPAINVSEKTDSDVNMQPLNSGKQDLPVENNTAAKVLASKNPAPDKKDKQTVQNTSQLSPAEQTASAETVTEIAPKEEKEPEPDPKRKPGKI